MTHRPHLGNHAVNAIDRSTARTRRPSGRRRVALCVAAALGAGAAPGLQVGVPASAVAAAPTRAIRLVAAPTRVVDVQGAVWSPDARFALGGRLRANRTAIAGTTNDRVFQPERWGLTGYDVPVPASGAYRVTVNTSETSFRRAGQRVFAVSAEGRRVATGVDIARRVGFAKAYPITFTTVVRDGVLSLRFSASKDRARVSSLVVEQVTQSDVVARMVAGRAPVKDAAGRVWSPDAAFADGGTTWSGSTPIGGTADDRLFQSERWGVRGYQVPVPAPGWYRVTLNAAELVFTRPGQRVFTVTAEGQTVLRAVDLVKAVGRSNAYAATFTVRVTDGGLSLRLPASVNHAKVASLQVQRVAGAERTVLPKAPAPVPASTPTPTPPPSGAPTPAPTPPPTGPGTVSGVDGSPMTIDPVSPRGGPFGTQSFWRTSVRDAPLAADSAALSANLAGQVERYYNGVAAFNVWSYTQAIYTVAPSQQRVDVKWDDCQGKGYVPRGLLGPGGQFTSVPMPSDAKPSAGNDRSISVYQPSTDQLWGFWKANKQADGWHACWGGRIDDASSSQGYYPNGFGTTATGLAGEGGTVNIKDVQAGRIDHALVLQVVDAANWNNFSWPAQRSDGASHAVDAIPEGTRFRLDPAVDVDALHLHPIATMIAKAAQRYGFVVSDKAGAVSVVAEDGVPTQSRTGTNPWTALLAGRPGYSVLAGFPWGSMQALPRDYGKP